MDGQPGSPPSSPDQADLLDCVSKHFSASSSAVRTATSYELRKGPPPRPAKFRRRCEGFFHINANIPHMTICNATYCVEACFKGRSSDEPTA